MWNTFQYLFDYKELLEVGPDVAIYSAMALVGTGFFILRLLVGFIGDIGGGLDIDIDADVDGSASFSVFSIMSITAFLMGTGWMGLAARLDLKWGAGYSALLSSSFGLVLMFGSAGAMYAIRQLGEEKTYRVKTAVGKVGTVYLTIPGENQGSGQVRVSVSGRSMICDARTTGPELAAFDEVVVKEAREDGTLIVEKYS